MRQFFIIAVVVLVATLNVSADNTYISKTKRNGHPEANNLWRKFIGCGNPGMSDKLITSCLKETGTDSLATVELSKVFEFLTLGLEVTELGDCSATQKKSTIKSRKNDFLCFRILGLKTSSTGYVYFERKKDTLKISKIKY